MATGIIGSGPYGARPDTTAPKATGGFFQNALKQVPSAQPYVKDARPAIQAKPYFVGQQPATHSITGTPIFHRPDTTAPKPPSPDDLTFQNQAQAIGPDVLRQAANPKVAALHDVLASVTGIPALVAAATSGKHLGAAAVTAASFLPFGRVGKLAEGVTQAVEDIKAGRTAEEATQHIAQAAQKARTEGFGPQDLGAPMNPPRLKPGEVTPETGGEAGATVRAALAGKPPKGIGVYEKVGAKIDNPAGTGTASEARAAQDVLYSQERATRAAAAEEALKRGDYEAALHELKGALPKVDFQGFKQLDAQTVKAMENHVMDHSALRTFEKINTIQTIRDAVGGKVPTASGQRLLERAFGKEVSSQISQAASDIRKWPKVLIDLANVPRSVMASTDLSAPFRQGLVAGVSHPILFAKNFAPMVKAARSEPYFQQMIQDEIHGRPTYPLMEKAKVAFTDIGKDSAHGSQAQYQREEQFMSNYAERIPGFGRVVRGSDRAYVGFLNRTRADIFDHLLQEAARQGRDVNDEHLLQSVARFVNSATGRGTLGALTNHTASLNALFFAPRLLASRINFLNPVYYARLDPFARREALKAFLALGATAATILEIAKMGGAKVSTDPTNADFAKIRVGNTRVDLLGGFQQPVRFSAQMALKRITSSTTGQVIPLGSGIAKTSRYDVFMKFLQGKLSPIPSLVVDALKGQDFTGQAVKWNDLSSWERQAANHMVPFLAQDLYSLETTSGPASLGLAPLDLFGVGIQSYKGKVPKRTLTIPVGYGHSGGGSSGGYGTGGISSGGPYGAGG